MCLALVQKQYKIIIIHFCTQQIFFKITIQYVYIFPWKNIYLPLYFRKEVIIFRVLGKKKFELFCKSQGSYQGILGETSEMEFLSNIKRNNCFKSKYSSEVEVCFYTHLGWIYQTNGSENVLELGSRVLHVHPIWPS